MLKLSQQMEILEALDIETNALPDMKLELLETYVEMRTAEKLLKEIDGLESIGQAKAHIRGYFEGSKLFLEGRTRYEFK